MASDILIIPSASTIQFTSTTGNYNAVIQKSDGTLNFTGKTSYSGSATFHSTLTANTNENIATINASTGDLEIRSLNSIVQREWKEISGTTYTTTSVDRLYWLRCTNGAGVTISFDNSNFDDGDTILITQYGKGKVAVKGDSAGLPSTTTIVTPTGFPNTKQQYSTIFGKYIKTPKVLVLGGDLEDREPNGAAINTSQTTTSLTYTDLTTLGPQSTVTIGPKGTAIVMLTAEAMTNTNGGECMMGFAVSGSTTVSANDDQALTSATRNTGDTPKSSATFWVTGLTEGSNTFTAKYRTTTGTATFADRNIIVIPIN